MSKLRKSSMKEQCHAIIRGKILRQEYALGQDINIVSLCNELSVSNTPVREALSLLEAEGLVVTSLNSKVRVVTFDQNSFIEMSQTLAILETGAYRLCLEEEQIPSLTERMKLCLEAQKERLRQQDFHEFINETIAFDKAILDTLGNARLLSVFDSIAGILFLLFRTKHQQDQNQRQLSIDEHSQILEATAAGDHQQVLYLLKHHYSKKL